MYLIPHVIVVSITMPLAATNGGVPRISLDYPRALRHELRSIQSREVSTMKDREKVRSGKLIIWVRSARDFSFKSLTNQN